MPQSTLLFTLAGLLISNTISASPLSATSADRLPDPSTIPITRNSDQNAIQWTACNATEFNTTFPFDCGTLRVPKDYTQQEPRNETIELQLARVPAKTQPSRGTIQFNFGGPGDPGRSGLALLGCTLQTLTGGEYDLVAFDPRGTGNTLPAECLETQSEGVELLGGLVLGNASDVAVGKLWGLGEVNAKKCQEKVGEELELMGTAFGARDLMQVAEAVDGDGMLRFWGLSYGTTLGATVAAMFPDRIDKMIMDGVQNPHEYYHALANFEEWTGSDRAFSAIFTSCLETAENCALSKFNATASELEQMTWDLLDQIKYQPLPIGDFLLEYSTLKGIFQSALYDTADWPGLATQLALIFSNQTEALGEALGDTTSVSDPLATLTTMFALYGIQCGDRTARASELSEFMPTVEKLSNISRIYGDGTVSSMAACAQWKFDAKERYDGDFQVSTRNPVLFLGNTGDAHTPLVSAYNVSSGFEGSVVLEIDGYGHASTAVPSSCSWKHIQAYWKNGILPPKNTTCEAAGKPFDGMTWKDVFSGNTTKILRKDADVAAKARPVRLVR